MHSISSMLVLLPTIINSSPQSLFRGEICRLNRLLVILAAVTVAAVDASVLVLVVITLPLIPPSLRPFLPAVLRPFFSAVLPLFLRLSPPLRLPPLPTRSPSPPSPSSLSTPAHLQLLG
jgi:hypothetical protein